LVISIITVSPSVNAPDLAREAVGKNLGGVAGEIEDAGFALLEAGEVRDRARNQPTDFVGHVGEGGLDIARDECVPGCGDEFLVLFDAHDRYLR
jgi:hypothetical protein